MKTFILALLLFPYISFAQNAFPSWLEGSWNSDDNQIFERWDKLNDSSFKGIAYEIKNDKMTVNEYLAIKQTKDGIYYSASVINQNNGNEIFFKLTQSDSIFVFENSAHDFPKKISYKIINENRVLVEVSDGKLKSFSYFMNKAVSNGSAGNPNYDSLLANRLGADDYGMKYYIFAILKTGAKNDFQPEFVKKCFREHLANIEKLEKQGKLIIAGPFKKNEKNYRGIFVLNNVENLELAKELLQSDPAIKAGLLDMELFYWYGSAALPEYLKPNDKIWKIKP